MENIYAPTYIHMLWACHGTKIDSKHNKIFGKCNLYTLQLYDTEIQQLSLIKEPRLVVKEKQRIFDRSPTLAC